MSGIRAMSHAARINMLLALLEEKPRTIKEASLALEWSYHTVRNYIVQHNSEFPGKIRIAGYEKSGAAIYTVEDEKPMPRIYVEASDTWVPISTYSVQYAANNFDSYTKRAVGEFAFTVTELLYLAHAIESNQITPAAAKEQVRDINRRMEQSHRLLASTAKAAKAIIDNPRLWDVEELTRIVADPAFPKDVSELYDSYVRHRSESA